MLVLACFNVSIQDRTRLLTEWAGEYHVSQRSKEWIGVVLPVCSSVDYCIRSVAPHQGIQCLYRRQHVSNDHKLKGEQAGFINYSRSYRVIHRVGGGVSRVAGINEMDRCCLTGMF